MTFSTAGLSEKAYYKHRSVVLKDSLRRYWLKRQYNLTPEEYDALLRKQGGVCAICSKPPAQKRLAIDHNHNTSQVRGLLCTSCNTKLGWYETNQEQILQHLSLGPTTNSPSAKG